ncbi:MAG: hypothetical protein ACREP7_11805, partial [Lysobacter sp.]
AWARSVPFVWAVVIPLLACVFVSFLDVMPGIEIPHGAIWYVIGLRGLLSIVPGTWFLNESVAASAKDAATHGPQALTQSVDITSSLHALATADLWIGDRINRIAGGSQPFPPSLHPLHSIPIRSAACACPSPSSPPL